MVFCQCDASKEGVPHRLEFGQHIDEAQYVRLALRRDCVFVFSIFAELFYCIVLDAGAFLDLQHSFDCWFIMDGSYEKMIVFLLCFFR